MRVALDTTYSRLAPRSGTAVYTRMLSERLSRQHGVEVVELFNRRRRPPSGGGPGSVRNLLADRHWSASELPRLARGVAADVIHHPLPPHLGPAEIPQVVTVMDLAFERLPQCFDWRFRAYARRVHRRAALRAGAVVCISETTAADARELWGVEPERLVLAPLGPGQQLPVATAERRHFLYVGDAEPRKNLSTLIEAYRIYRRDEVSPLPLLLAGAAGATGAGIEVRSSPGDEELARLYAGAVALLHPSRYEGFGLTALEAMATGTPVIAARSPGVTEVCAEAAIYADALSAEQFAEAMRKVAGDPGLREDLAARGRRRAGEFSWDGCARAHLDAYSLARTRA